MRPYFGITDFTSIEEVRAMEVVMRAYRPTPDHMLHVGVMMSRKSLHGEPTRWAAAWLKNEAIKDVLSDDRVYNCLHYADFAEEQDAHLALSLAKAMSYGGPKLHGLQLDMVWPYPPDVIRAKAIARKVIDISPEIILQLGGKALDRMHNDPVMVTGMLAEYGEGIDRVLLDRSGGMGVPLDASALLPFCEEIMLRLPRLGITVAGGLSAETMHLMGPIWKEFPNISIDAQGALRPSRNAMDPIDWGLAEAYLRAACEENTKYQLAA